MSAFVLNLLPDGKAILTTESELSASEAVELKAVWDQFIESEQNVAIIADCRVQHIDSIDLVMAEGKLVLA